ncbi:hypothetical protein HNY73_020163 [Argiope bruennichi]|uniref:MADF domain-containing protein n=1 Tax=Argiope bruennichi TaxID=94029 RepID=A0A8T0E8G9_ARGBR|nr:hypothetical protein HNY73_020163 [Argiope bruennichi]
MPKSWDRKHEWTYEMESVLILLMMDFPFLWNSNYGYFNRFDRRHDWMMLVCRMRKRFPQNSYMFSVAAIKNKFHNLKQNYLSMVHRQDALRNVPCRRSLGHYDELSLLKKAFEERNKVIDLTEPSGSYYVRCVDQGVTTSKQGSLEKPEDGASCSPYFSTSQPILSQGESLQSPLSLPSQNCQDESVDTVGRMRVPKIESLKSCACRCHYEDSDPDRGDEMSNRNSSSQEAEVPTEDANASGFSVNEENHETTNQENSNLPAVEIVFSPNTLENLRLDNQLDSFGNFVSASLKRFCLENRKRMMLEICNMLLNPRI